MQNIEEVTTITVENIITLVIISVKPKNKRENEYSKILPDEMSLEHEMTRI